MLAAALRSRRAVRVTLWVLAVAGLAVPLLTVRRVPTPFADLQLYASIALSRHLYGIGIPTVTWNSPTAVDHIPFYGPVFFDLAAASIGLFGPRLASFRLVSVVGALLFLLGTVLLARQFTRSRDRVLLAAVLVLLTPEMNFAMSTGAMHMLAIGFEVLALAVFVKDFDRRRGGATWGLAAGMCLALAALTTPRSLPFIFAFVCAALVPAFFGTARGAIRYRFAAAMLVLVLMMLAWARFSHGSIAAWLRYMTYIGTHEDTDVALLPTAVRDFAFHWSALLLPGAAVGFGGLAAWSAGRPRRTPATGAEAGAQVSRDSALGFLVACAWIELVTTAVVLNYTFANADYIALPLFAVVVAWPWNNFAIRRRPIAFAMGALLALEILFLAYRYTGLAANWASHDPDRINAFVARYVPPGSAVVGDKEPFLFPVERSGSRYRTVEARSWADWARWVPEIEPDATRVARAMPQPEPQARFFIWADSVPAPVDYACALGSIVAHYDAPPIDVSWPAWIRAIASRYPGYPSATLYRLPPGCPTGYDPTRPPSAGARKRGDLLDH